MSNIEGLTYPQYKKMDKIIKDIEAVIYALATLRSNLELAGTNTIKYASLHEQMRIELRRLHIEWNSKKDTVVNNSPSNKVIQHDNQRPDQSKTAASSEGSK